MKKIKFVYFTDDKEELLKLGGDYATGIFLELEDGTILRHQSTTDVFQQCGQTLEIKKN